MKILLSFSKDTIQCPNCYETIDKEGQPHKCQEIKTLKMINKRIREGVLKWSLVFSLVTIIGFMSLLLYLNWKIIAMQNDTLRFCRNEMEVMTRTTAVILDTQTEVKAGRGWKPDQSFYSWISSITNR
jgi:hypothetical protein